MDATRLSTEITSNKMEDHENCIASCHILIERVYIGDTEAVVYLRKRGLSVDSLILKVFESHSICARV